MAFALSLVGICGITVGVLEYNPLVYEPSAAQEARSARGQRIVLGGAAFVLLAAGSLAAYAERGRAVLLAGPSVLCVGLTLSTGPSVGYPLLVWVVGGPVTFLVSLPTRSRKG